MFEGVEGKAFIAPNAGPDADDSDVVDTANGKTAPVTVVAGQETTDVDAGVEAVPGSLSGRYFCDDNRDGLDNDDFGGGPSLGVEGVMVALLDANGDPATDIDGNPIVAVMTDIDGNYSFGNLAEGTYSVVFTDAVSGKELTTPNANGNADDAIDSDAIDQGNGVSRIDNISVVAGQDTPDNDAGVVPPLPPIPTTDDEAETCADETVAVDVVSNDGEPGATLPLTITKVDGQEIDEGLTITTSMGTLVTLLGGELVIDGSDNFKFLDIGETRTETISYMVSDGISTGAATLEVTFCGDANSAESLDAALKANGGTQVTFDLPNPPTLAAFAAGYDLDLQSSTNADIPLGLFTAAYCLDVTQPINFDTVTTADVCILTEANLAAVAPTVDATKFDSINWLLNNDFTQVDNGDGTNDTYTDLEVQEAIWLMLNGQTGFINNPAFTNPEFMDDDNGVRDGVELATLQNAQEIAMAAMTQGDGFVAGDGDIIGLIIDPFDPASQTQPFVVGVNFDDIDCIC